MTTASVPLITKKMQADLRAAGFSDDEIANLTPAEAWAKLGGLPQNVLAAAKLYRDSGLSFIPLRRVKGDVEASKVPDSHALKASGWVDAGTKKPTWKLAQERLATDSELNAWFGNGRVHNIGLVLGSVSRGLVAIDFDDKAVYDAWAAAYPHIAKTATQRTGKGYHVLVRMSPAPGNGKFTYNGIPGGDIKGEGGYIVAAPSVHGSGSHYEWLPGQSLSEIGILAINSLADIGIEADVTEPTKPAAAPTTPANGFNPFDVLKAIATIPNPQTRQKLLAAAKLVLSENEPAKTVNVLSADDIMATDYPELTWVIPDLLPVGLTILAGKPKMGKSWLALQMAQAVAAGGKLFDKGVLPGPVLFCALEDSPRRLKDRMVKQNWPGRLPVDFLAIGEFDKQIGGFANGGIDTLAELIQTKQYRMVVIDTLSRALQANKIKDARSSVEMVGAMSPIQEMAHKCNTAVVLIDHMRKQGGADIDVVSDTMDSISKAGIVDNLWGLYRERGKVEARLQITGRDVDETTLAIKMDWLTAAWQCEGDYYAKKLSESKQQILDALEALGSATNQKIADTTGQNKGNTLTRLKELVAAGLVSQTNTNSQILYSIK